MKTRRFKAIITVAIIVLMGGCLGQTKAVSSNVHEASSKDFSISLYNVKREENIATLYFAITKISEGRPDFIAQIPQQGKVSAEEARAEVARMSQLLKVPIALIDDHGNRYKGNLDIDLNYSDIGILIIDSFPKGFTYTDTVRICMPKIAPIEKVIVGNKEISFKKAKLTKPKFPKDFGNFTGIRGQQVRVGKWLSFTMGEKIIPSGRIWQFPLVIENEDYNPASVDIIFGTQLYDGRIYWDGCHRKIEALSKFSDELRIVNMQYCGYTEEFTYPIAFIVMGINESTLEAFLRIFPLTPNEFPILVGQGLKGIQKVFIQAYNRNGGRKTMGDPLNLPRWFAGGDKPKDENDVLIQEFPAVSDFGKSAIIWDKQAGAYVLRGKILETYRKFGGPYGPLGNPTSDQVTAQSSFKTKGSYGSFEKGMLVSHHGKIYTVSGKILEKWQEKKFVKGPLGFPTMNEQPTRSGAEGFDTTAQVQRFEGGNIYSFTSGKLVGQSLSIEGGIYQKYREIGGEKSWLGFPIQDCYGSPENSFGPYEFEGGYIATPDKKVFQAFHYEPGKSIFISERIAFVSNRDGNEEIYVTNAMGRKQINLTKNPADDWAPSWSPDGSYIAFVSNRDGGNKIYIMNADGTNPRFLVEGEDPCWFPDGSKIAYSKKGRIFIINIDGTGERKITPDRETAKIKNFKFRMGLCHASPAISPDGTKIAFAAGNWNYGFSYMSFVMDLDGTNLRYLEPHLYRGFGGKWVEGPAANPSWSPDGQKIAFRFDTGHFKRMGHTGRIHGGNIYISNVDTHTKPIKLPAWCYGKLSWAQNGAAIVYSDRSSHISIIRISDKTISTIVREGQNWDPDWWSPSSKSLKHKEQKINLNYSVSQFIPESATGTAFSLPVVKSPEHQAYFPWICSYIDTAWSVVLPITFQVTDSDGNPISGAQIFMGQMKLGVTDNNGKFIYKYVVRIPKRENKVIKLPFSAKKNGNSVSIDIPFSWSILEETSIHIATKEDLDRYTQVLYKYEFFKSKLPLPKELTPLSVFLPLLKTVYDLKKGPQIGDRIDIFLIEHRIDGKKPVAWAYWELAG